MSTDWEDYSGKLREYDDLIKYSNPSSILSILSFMSFSSFYKANKHYLSLAHTINKIFTEVRREPASM